MVESFFFFKTVQQKLKMDISQLARASSIAYYAIEKKPLSDFPDWS